VEGKIQFVGYTDQHDKLQAMLTLKKRKNVEICLNQITGLILAFFIGNKSSLTDLGQEYKWCPAGNIMGSTWYGITCITKAVSWWQVSRTSFQLMEPNGNDGTWTMTGTKCAAIKRLISIMRSGDKTEFINRLKTPNLINRNGRIFSRRDQIQMPMDEVPTEEVASQQQAIAVAEGPLQDMTVTCRQCEVTFVSTKGEQRFFQGKKMTQPAQCPECRKWIRKKGAETASKNRFEDSPSGPKFKTAILVWTMCEGWRTEARNDDERSGMQARITKQRELVEITLRELPWIESGSLVRDFWSAVEYGGIPQFLGRLKTRQHALMAKWGQGIFLGKNKKQRDFSLISSWMQWQWQWSLELCERRQPQTSATGNVISWSLGPLGLHAAQPYIAQAMRKNHLVYMRRNLTSHRPCERSSALLPVRITTARRPDHIRLSALVQSRSTQFIVHASSQLGHAGPWPPETRSFFCHFGGVMFLTPLVEVTPYKHS